MNHAELLQIESEKLRFRRIVELNIKEQCLNIFKINMVQRNQHTYGFPRIHGLVYDIHSGELKPLDIDFKRYLHAYSGIYRLHAFHSDDTFPPTVQQMRRNMIQRLAVGHEEDDDGETISAHYIARVLKMEPDLFTPLEVDAGIAFAQHESNDSDPQHCAFIKIAHLVEYFAPCTDDGDHDHDGDGNDEQRAVRDGTAAVAMAATASGRGARRAS